ncbi:hypothetical protein ABTK92_20045, partial [Acinetobacter baumannii]
AMAIDSDANRIDLSKVNAVTAIFKDTTVAKVKEFFTKYKADPRSAGTPPESVQLTAYGLKSTPVEWWKFVACVGFGILMAFAFEILT